MGDVVGRSVVAAPSGGLGPAAGAADRGSRAGAESCGMPVMIGRTSLASGFRAPAGAAACGLPACVRDWPPLGSFSSSAGGCRAFRMAARTGWVAAGAGPGAPVGVAVSRQAAWARVGPKLGSSSTSAGRCSAFRMAARTLKSRSLASCSARASIAPSLVRGRRARRASASTVRSLACQSAAANSATRLAISASPAADGLRPITNSPVARSTKLCGVDGAPSLRARCTT